MQNCSTCELCVCYVDFARLKRKGFGLSTYLAMPACSLSLEGVAEAWGAEVQLLSRLTTAGRLFLPHGTQDLKASNRDVAHNFAVLKPLVECMGKHATWDLFKLDVVEKERLVK